MNRIALWLIALGLLVPLLVGCGADEKPEGDFLGTGVDRDERITEGLYRKTLVSRAYSVLAEQINVHTEPFEIEPFSKTERVWVIGWKTTALGGEGEFLPEDIQCHTLLTNHPLYQEEETPFEGICTDGFTPVFKFPEGFGLSVRAGMRLHYQPMFNNRHDEGCRVRMKLEVDYVPDSEIKQPMRALHCFALSVCYPDMYWVAPHTRDVLTREFEMTFSGRIHAIGGHIHPTGEFVELKRVRDGEVMFTAVLSKEEKLADRRLSTYSSEKGFYVRKGETFLMTSIHDNQGDERADAMGGFFIFFDPEGKPDA